VQIKSFRKEDFLYIPHYFGAVLWLLAFSSIQDSL